LPLLFFYEQLPFDFSVFVSPSIQCGWVSAMSNFISFHFLINWMWSVLLSGFRPDFQVWSTFFG
jgi:hypothetical protein